MTTTPTEAIAAAVAPVVTNIAAANLDALQRSWYVINRKSDDEAEIRIYEDIGLFGVTAKQFADDLEQVGATRLHVRLNSYGGEAFDGIAIHNALKAHKAQVVIHVDGIAASAASIIAMSGDEIRMANNAFLMIHEARGGVMGEADDMRGYADMLDKLNDAIAATYQARAGGTRKYWRELMAKESWFSADEAKGEGLVDIIEETSRSAKNRFAFPAMNHAPEAARRQWGATTENQPGEAPPAAPPVTETSPGNQPTQAAPGVPVPANSSQQETNMAENTPATPAQTPAPVANVTPPAAIDQAEAHKRKIEELKGLTAEATFMRGRNEGITEGRKQQAERMKEILAACPGKPEMAIEAFLNGQEPAAVKMAFDQAAKVEAAAKLREQEKDAEIARWQALAATGGYPGGVGMAMDDGTADDAPQIDPKTQAEQEWEHKPAVRKGFSKKENYVAYRVAQLSGRVQIFTEPASA